MQFRPVLAFCQRLPEQDAEHAQRYELKQFHSYILINDSQNRRLKSVGRTKAWLVLLGLSLHHTTLYERVSFSAGRLEV